MLGAAERIRAAVYQQRAIADRMEQYRNVQLPNQQQQKRMARLAKQQELLRQELENATQDLQQAAEAAMEMSRSWTANNPFADAWQQSLGGSRS